ncbi:MAG: ATP-binding protein [Candidatus Krumholzibacteriaceae bacterium]
MLGLRQKLSFGFGGLLVILLFIGIQSILYITRLGGSIDVILRENYRSVIACQDMKEALERMDSGALLVLLGYEKNGEDLIRSNEGAFEKALTVEFNNITVPGELELATRIKTLYERYLPIIANVTDPTVPVSVRRARYYNELLPLFYSTKGAADDVLRLNQQNMIDMNDRARASAASARREMYSLLIAGTMVAVGFMLLARRWILQPINRLIESADEIKRGNLDVVVLKDSNDEIGHLSDAFNAMAAKFREFRRFDQAKLARIQRATQQAFDSFPEAVAVIDLEGQVEVATEAARTVFGLMPGIHIHNLPYDWIVEIWNGALAGVPPARSRGDERAIQRFVKGEERYFRPEAVPILDAAREPTGVVLVLQDITQLQQQNEIKRGLISTVSHELRTPLASMRMAIHLLLEERVGGLTDKQVELLVAAREDSDRLNSILSGLLDISRIESGRQQMEFRALSPYAMAMDAIEPFRRAAQDQGVTLNTELPEGLPDVWADTTRIGHVFANLLSNALKHTPPGGTVTVSAALESEGIQFSVADTGTGIPPEYLSRIFEQFFRIPRQKGETGAGLGLTIVKEIVEAHGGTVGARSQVGKGSTFSFTLKRADLISREEMYR